MRSIDIKRVFSACFFKQRAAIFSLAFLALVVQLGRAADALRFTKNYFVTGDVVTAGVGDTYGRGVNGFATGTINMSGASGVPCTGGSPAVIEPCSTPGAVPATIVAAFLYWSTVEMTSTPSGANAFFDGNAIVGTVRGNPNNSGCWSSGGTSSGAGRVYGADVRRFLPPDQTDSVRTANGPHVVKLPDSGGGGNGNVMHSLGASLVVVYKFVVPGQPLFVPLRSVVIYDGAFTMDKFTATTTQTVGGVYDALGGTAKMTQIVANGQSFNTETLTINNAPPLSGPSTPFMGAAGSRWDNPTFGFNLAAHANSVPMQLTTSDHQLCLTYVAIMTSTPVTDTDHDGLLDVWETNGLHLNPGDSTHPATFGGCADYPTEPCVNLPKMGADPLKQDIFVEIDWLKVTPLGAYPPGAPPAHEHIPKLAALKAIGDTFSSHLINLHFDVGNNYQTSGSPYIVPAAYAQGGEVIEESLLVCPNAVVTNASLCAYSEPYSVLSWKLGYQDVRNGNSALGIPAHFAYNRKDAFHYALFGHALGGPFDPTTGKPKSTNPNSVSGIADLPGGDFMVTLGLWPADDPIPCDPSATCVNQTGSVKVQAGTIMHELGHNLGLGHAGAYRTPNCMPNYPSVMNYLHQVHLLTGTVDGLSYLDYSSGQRPSLTETSLNENVPLGGPPYRVRFYAPASSVGTPAPTHCDGTPTGGALMVRIESPNLSHPDWNNNGIVDTTPYSQDINFDGLIGVGVAGGPDFKDSNDWANLNLQQISARPNGGLSSGVGILEDPSGGILEDPSGGVLEDPSGGVLEDPSGGVLEDPSGGVLEDPSGGILSDVNHDTTASQPVATGTAPGEALAATSSLTAITLNWGAPDPSLAQIDYFNVYRTADPSGLPATATFIGRTPSGTPLTTTFTDTANGTTTLYNQTYTYFVTAVVKITGVESVFSNSASGIVVKVPLTVTANNKSRAYGAANPAFDVSYAGFTGGDTVASLGGTLVCTSTATSSSPVGNYPIICTGQTSAKYLISYVPGTLTINPLAATWTTNANSKTYGSPDPDPLTTGSGTFLAADGVTATYTRVAGETVAGGPYHITAALSPAGVLSNYTITNAGASFTINKATASVTPNANGKTYGTSDPVPLTTGTLTGFLAADTVTATYSRTAGETVAGSPYTISATLSPLGVLGNYNITYNTANFTVGPASQAAITVTGPASVTFGTTGTATFSGGSGTGLVTFSAGASTGCSVAGSTVSVSNASGTCSLTVTKAADSNYNVATSAPFTVTLVKASQATLTVTGPSSVTFGTTGTAASSGGSGGGAVSFSAGSSTGCSVTGTTVSVSNASGTCSLTVTKAADNNYNSATSVGFAVTLVKASQTITLGPIPTHDETDPPFTVTPPPTASSGLPVSLTASGQCTVSGNTVTIIHGSAGSCTVTAHQAGDGNYNAAPDVAQTFAITI